MHSTTPTNRQRIDWRGRPVDIEYLWLNETASGPVLVFLHEGLGSIAMWRDFPARLCAATGLRGLVFSRPGYGRSTQRAPGESWAPDYLHRQAREVLPALLAALGVDARARPPWLFGHSDGGSIALLYASMFPTAGAIVAAPHIVVEDISVDGIRKTVQAYRDGGLRDRLARFHDDPDSPFLGWSDAWLDPAFRRWRIVDDIAAIDCPVLAMQGVDDEYGTLDQIRGIARVVPHAQVLEIEACGHSPHKDQPDIVIDASRRLVEASRSN
ncbi:alpha/beta hydrolase [Roseateles aquatilis]|uniref:Alpha/beta hydrolase n=1 Tax=Roseateles aquatilis TaxID=431061 RepID=A0A246JI94_9BURK|nr:alpha/beta hydrolase [Roseateles aquatilis]OWQ92347.1 alpha/beta hydrolase [Roseateles aquatilis]